MKNSTPMKIFTAFLIFLSFTGFGQTPESNSTKKFLIGLTFSPDYCYRTLNPSASAQVLADMRDTMEIPKAGFTAGLSLLVQINKRFAIEAGLQYSDKGEKTKVRTLIPLEPLDPSLPSNRISDNYHYKYLNIPLLVNYCFTAKNPKVFLSTGISTNLFIKQTTTVKFIDSNEKISSKGQTDFAKINMMAMLGIGIDYQIIQHLTIRFQPLFSYSITPIYNGHLKEYLYSIGANIGFYYQLN